MPSGPTYRNLVNIMCINKWKNTFGMNEDQAFMYVLEKMIPITLDHFYGNLQLVILWLDDAVKCLWMELYTRYALIHIHPSSLLWALETKDVSFGKISPFCIFSRKIKSWEKWKTPEKRWQKDLKERYSSPTKGLLYEAFPRRL